MENCWQRTPGSGDRKGSLLMEKRLMHLLISGCCCTAFAGGCIFKKCFVFYNPLVHALHPVAPISPPSKSPPMPLPILSQSFLCWKSLCKQLFTKPEFTCLCILNCCCFAAVALLTQCESVQVNEKKNNPNTAVSEVVRQ